MLRGSAWASFAVAFAFAVASALASSRAASADSARRADLASDPDPTAGRIEGDLAVVGGLGATVGNHGTRGALDVRLRYVETAGVFVTYEDAFDASSSGPARALATGVELRPLFLARWLTGRELSIPWLDLTIDSLGLELGACFQQPGRGTFDSLPALQAGPGLELPLFARATGLWLGFHGGGRWSDTVQAGGPSERTAFVSITLAYHQVLKMHLVDLHDRAP